MTAQLALFDPMEEKRAAAAAALTAWQAQFERRDMVAGNGQTFHGWVCPNCKAVEPNGFLLQTNHGWCPEIPGDKPYDPTYCTAMRLVAGQQWWRRGKENPCPDCGHPAGDGCVPSCPTVLAVIRREERGDVFPSASCEACGADAGQVCRPTCPVRPGLVGDS